MPSFSVVTIYGGFEEPVVIVGGVGAAVPENVFRDALPNFKPSMNLPPSGVVPKVDVLLVLPKRPVPVPPNVLVDAAGCPKTEVAVVLLAG